VFAVNFPCDQTTDAVVRGRVSRGENRRANVLSGHHLKLRPSALRLIAYRKRAMALPIAVAAVPFGRQTALAFIVTMSLGDGS
jgi:hypothetical protein